MEPIKICQSCARPLQPVEMLGTEADGSRSKEYCAYCYQKGAFTNPSLTFADMEELVESQMPKLDGTPDLIHDALEALPHLKRWKGDPHLL